MNSTVKVKVVKTFLDRENDLARREVGTEFETTQIRAEYLKIQGLVEIVVDEPETVEKPKKAKKTENK